MAQVSNQTELIVALAARESLVQIAVDFSVNTQVNISYSVTFESVSADIARVLSKDASYYSYLFRISNGGSLTVRNLVIDGTKDVHGTENTANRSLVSVAGGSLTLGEGAELRNNHSYMEGGAVYLSGNASYTNTFVMEDNAQISGCSSRSMGGGMIAALRNNGDRVAIRGNALFAENSSASGGGLYYRSYLEGVGVPLTIGENVSFFNNTATANGGGIYVSGYTGGGSPATVFTLTDSVRIRSNRANHGGGIYYYGANDGDGITISGAVDLSENQAANNGGGMNVTSVSGSLTVALSDGAVAQNQARSGGGVFLNSAVGCDFSLHSLAIQENRSLSGSGGGIWFGTNATASNPFACAFDSLILSGNSSAIHGGGIYFQSSSTPLSLTMRNCDARSNTAAQSGGGLLFNASGELRIYDSKISENVSGQYGGGMYFYTNQDIDSTVLMTNTTVFENTAAQSGGGLRLGTGNGAIATTLRDCVVEKNRAISGSGGGIWNSGTNASLTVNGSSRILRNATESGNGGGIYFNSTLGTLQTEDDVKIQYNTADTTASSSGNNGGGISIGYGTVWLGGNTEITNNSALRSGGGISLTEASTVGSEILTDVENQEKFF